MPVRIQHPIYGNVLSGDNTEIERLLKEGGVITNATKPIEVPEIEEVKEVQEVPETPTTPKRGRPRLNGNN